MKMKTVFLLFGLLISSAGFARGGVPTFGRYIGVLHHDRLHADQLAKLDLIPDRSDGETLKLVGILTLHFGDFASKEYVSYRFDRVFYNPLDGTLVINGSSQYVTLQEVTFNDNQITAELYSSSGEEKIGKIELRLDRAAVPTQPLLRPVEGLYHCDEKDEIFQLATLRSTTEKGAVGNPFGAYEIRGRLGVNREDMGGHIILDGITSGSYNFFNGSLILWGATGTYRCQIEGDAIDCPSQCRFERQGEVSLEHLLPPGAKDGVAPPHKTDAHPVLAEAMESVQRQYTGWVHHEYLDAYQAGTFYVSSYPIEGGEAGSVHMGISAKLFFGDSQSSEFVPYPLKDETYPLHSAQFVFKSPSTDAVVEVTSIDKKGIKGVWYSSLFGRVGTFEFVQGSKPPELPSGAKRMGEIHGVYSGSSHGGDINWRLDLVTGIGATSAMNPTNSIMLGGGLYAVNPELGQDRTPVEMGSYDFYTNKLSLLFKTGLLIGEWKGSDVLKAGWYVSSHTATGFFTHRAELSRGEE